MPKITEAAIQIAVFKWAAANITNYPNLNMLMATPNQGGANSGQWGAARKREGMAAGFPDISLLVARDGYHGLFLELKLPNGIVSSQQSKWIDNLNAQGYLAKILYVSNPLEVVDELLIYLSA